MSRLSFRRRLLDIHKKLPIFKSVKDFEDDESPTSATRNGQMHRLAAAAAEVDAEVQPIPNKKLAPEIPTPQFVVVDREIIHAHSFNPHPICGQGESAQLSAARAEIGEFVEYDLDNEDEDWLQVFNKDKKILAPEKLENLLFKLELLDRKARERAGVITPTLVSPIPVLLIMDAAIERERWHKPILRRLQPPPPVNDNNPYNVFRATEKAHRLNTGRMQRRENYVKSFEKLRLESVRTLAGGVLSPDLTERNLDQAKTLLEALIKREEKKRDVMECEVSLQGIQMKYKHETGLLEDIMPPVFLPLSSKFGSSEDEFMDSDDLANSHQRTRPAAVQNPPLRDSNVAMAPAGTVKVEIRQRHILHGWLQKLDSLEPVL